MRKYATQVHIHVTWKIEQIKKIKHIKSKAVVQW